MCGPTGCIIEDGEKILARLIKKELRIDVNEAALRLFIRANWPEVAALAHRIHKEP